MRARLDALPEGLGFRVGFLCQTRKEPQRKVRGGGGEGGGSMELEVLSIQCPYIKDYVILRSICGLPCVAVCRQETWNCQAVKRSGVGVTKIPSLAW